MSDEKEDNQKRPEKESTHHHLRLHYLVITLVYVVGGAIAYEILSRPESQATLVTLLSSGAILATFGSAIGAIGLIWQTDLHERVRLNVDILYRDILEQESPWRRWPFLPRSAKRRLLNGDLHQLTLSNPEVPLDVGTHVIRIHLPTVMEDYFDLPLFANFWPLFRFRSSAHTVFGRKKKEEKNEETGLSPSGEYMAYECMFDIWSAILKFRISRYIIHIGSGFTIFGALLAGFYAATFV
ncbi:hypothetical protein [Halopseudomonas pelagia]|uniref:hypothetical protein n=1 Tax=Halopseudomonas pelagia TaxID=553151 RepID=UPI0003B7B68F|nr:hypothetical protein [Halopseudomonas pelagia]